jgi:4-aminobutyrate aminotransferase
LETIRVEGLLGNASSVGAALLAGLARLRDRHPTQITEVRGIGLMIGVEFRSGELADAVQQAAFERGLLVLECGERTIRMSPPLVVTAAQAEVALRVFEDAIDAVGDLTG